MGFNLRRLRLKRGMSQESLAGDQMDTAHVSRIERGVENPTVVVLDNLARALGVPVRDLFRPVREGSLLPPPLKAGRKKAAPANPRKRS